MLLEKPVLSCLSGFGYTLTLVFAPWISLIELYVNVIPGRWAICAAFACDEAGLRGSDVTAAVWLAAPPASAGREELQLPYGFKS
jgi:hypothetical protein